MTFILLIFHGIHDLGRTEVDIKRTGAQSQQAHRQGSAIYIDRQGGRSRGEPRTHLVSQSRVRELIRGYAESVLVHDEECSRRK